MITLKRFPDSFLTLLFFCLFLFFASGLLAQDTIVQEKEQDTISLSCSADETFTFSATQLDHLPFKTLTDISLITPSAYYLKGKRMFYFGVEANGASVFIDGMQVSDAGNFPLRSIENYTFFGYKAPIYMGNALTGFTGIETKNLTEKWDFDIDAYTDLANVMQTYTAEFALGGPLASKKRRAAGKRVPVFFIGGKYEHTNNADPVWNTNLRLKPEVLSGLQADPLRPTEYNRGTYRNAEFVTADNFTDGGVPDNAGRNGWYSYAKIVVPFGKSFEVSAGNYSDISHADENDFANSVFNAANNAVITKRNFDNYLKFNQKFKLSEEIDLAYTFQFQYGNYYRRTESARHEDRFFDYGYAGAFTTYKQPTFELGSDSVDGVFYDHVWLLNSWDMDTLVTWKPGTVNPEMVAWTNDYYDIYTGQHQNHYENLDQIILGGGLINGSRMQNVYGLWQSAGRQPDNYSEANTEEYIGRLMLELNYKAHHFLFGAEYNKNIQRSYTISPGGLWNLMRGLTNFHLNELDRYNPIAIDHNGEVDTIIYLRRYDGDSQRQFDINLRKKLGLPVDGVDYILIDSYNKQDQTISYYDQYGRLQTIKVEGDLFSLDMFSADELLNDGSYYVRYSGYDYQGNRFKGKTGKYAFFDNRNIDAMRPVYYSAYIQDEFSWKNLHTSLGLRMDVYDANRPVLKDLYSMFPILTVTEAKEALPFEMDVPDNIGDDYYVYVDNIFNPGYVTGFREGHNWYNDDGTEIDDPRWLDAGYGISPLLEDPDAYRITEPEKTFEDFKRVLNFLPQINIDYTIRNRHCLYVHYNTHTQNPVGINDFRPEDYYFKWNEWSVIPNPALKPLRSGLLMAGFKSVLYKYVTYDVAYLLSTLDNYYYAEKLVGAYPGTYYTVLNSEKRISLNGFVLSVNYTNPKATGLFGGVNVTKLFPDETDKNYQDISDFIVNTMLGYHFGAGSNYQGPVWGNAKVFQDFTASLFYQYRKGTPYTAENINGTKVTKHTPAFNIINLKVRKGFPVGRNIWLDVYLLVENLLNIKNAFYVYPKTGLPDDDGFLEDPQWQEYINNQLSPESFRLLYRMKLNNPQNVDIPPIFRVGVMLNI